MSRDQLFAAALKAHRYHSSARSMWTVAAMHRDYARMDRLEMFSHGMYERFYRYLHAMHGLAR